MEFWSEIIVSLTFVLFVPVVLAVAQPKFICLPYNQVNPVFSPLRKNLCPDVAGVSAAAVHAGAKSSSDKSSLFTFDGEAG